MLSSPAGRRCTGILILCLAVLVLPWMAVQPSLVPPGDGYSDKVLHVGCFAGLAVVAFWSFSSGGARVAALLGLLLLGAGIEWAQTLTPGREGSLADLAADAAGLAVALILLRQWPWVRDMIGRDKALKATHEGD